ncbi:conserved hypothetical protein [Trichinella spiralis]|uniref:hypothetical protein n=1 Tax=Trichinella spiralis TaxID=6334 RepID=UPI0001EFB217|nr:conserved hypothetical protein [Trichinella spiralis]
MVLHHQKMIAFSFGAFVLGRIALLERCLRRAAAVKPPIPPISKTVGEDRRWLLAIDPHDTTRRYPISYCSGRLVIDPRGRRSLIIRWCSGSNPARNEPLIYRKTASRGIVSKTIGDQISVDPPPCSPAAKPFYILER